MTNLIVIVALHMYTNCSYSVANSIDGPARMTNPSSHSNTHAHTAKCLWINSHARMLCYKRNFLNTCFRPVHQLQSKQVLVVCATAAHGLTPLFGISLSTCMCLIIGGTIELTVCDVWSNKDRSHNMHVSYVGHCVTVITLMALSDVSYWHNKIWPFKF